MNGQENLGGEIPGPGSGCGSFLNTAACQCFPYPFCCGSGVPIPEYQVPLMSAPVNAGNFGSTQYRNYPDVAAVAKNLGTYADGGNVDNGGTSGAAPLWAGFMALADELSTKNEVGLVGFANPVLYEIGQTRGAPVDDFYSADFNDIADGVTNGWYGSNIATDQFGGYPAVAGYDLATGLGSPTCNLIYQLATTTPISSNNQPLPFLDMLITTGHDDLESQTGAVAAITFQSGAEIEVQLKAGQKGAQGGPHWNNGAMVDLEFDLAQYLPPSEIPTASSGVASITIKIVEDDCGDCYDEDNWDLSGLNVRLVPAPGGDIQEFCEFDIRGDSTLQDGHEGIVRFSSSAGSSGVGRQATFSTAPLASPPAGPVFVGSGCATTGAPNRSSQAAFPSIQFIFSTGSDDLRQDSGLVAYGYEKNGTQIDEWQLKSSGDASWQNDTQQNLTFELSGGIVPSYIHMNIQQHDQGLQTDDNWNCDGADLLTWQANGPEVCYYRNLQSASQAASDSPVLQVKDNFISFSLENCHAVAASQ
jgi:hypothetical protein